MNDRSGAATFWVAAGSLLLVFTTSGAPIPSRGRRAPSNAAGGHL